MATETQLTIPVRGMTCAACTSFVQKTLEAQPGVREASVNLMMASATVVLDPLQASPRALVEAINDAGFEAELPAARASVAAAELTREREDEQAYRATRLRAIVTLALGTAAMAAMPFFHHTTPELRWSLAAASLFSLVWAGARFYRKAWAALRHRTADMNTLVALGTGAAFLYSLFSPAENYFESVIFILGFVLTGNTLEARARRKTAAALQALAHLQPDTALVFEDGQERERPLAELQLGDLLVARPGARIACDGVVVEGASAVDEAMLTGEPLPVDKAPGSPVTGGTLNRHGRLLYRATALGAETTLEQILRLLRDAQGAKAPMQRLADRVSAVFVPAVLLLALATLAFTRSFNAAVSVLVIACPCAMGLAVPAAILVATGRAARLGLLFKNGEALERLNRIDTVVFDKTGTLTLGAPEVVAYEPLPGTDPLPLIAALERASEHPLAAALVRFAPPSELRASEFEALPGLGAEGRVAEHQVLVGNAPLLRARGIALPGDEAHSKLGRTVLYAAVDGAYAALFALADQPRPEAAQVLETLRRRGLRLVMLTGDQPPAARAIAAELGLTEVIAGVLPAGKLEALKQLQAEGRRVAMVGDGINDAPALAAAEAGISFAHGADVALAASDLTLVRSSLDALPTALTLARNTVRVMRQNLFWALIYNLIAIPAAMAGLLNPAVAAAAMSLSSFSVVANSLRLTAADR